MNTSVSNEVKTSMKRNKKSNTLSKRKKLHSYDPEEEARLRQRVFGDVNSIISNLPDENSDKNEKKEEKKAAWIDEDDAYYTVDEALKIRNRKFTNKRPENFYMEYLENQHGHIIGNPKWAEIDRVPDDFDDTDYDILKHCSHLEKPQLKTLPKNTIDIKAMKSINQQTFNEGPVISSLEFHPTSTIALVAGSAGILSLFQIDGKENNKLYSIQYKKFPISKAKFLKEGTEVILGSQFYSYCHSYNLMSGKTFKIPLSSRITNMKKYEISPDGRLITVCGRSGEIHLLTSSSKELVDTLKMNSKCRTISFTPDNRRLITHGDGNEMYIWDVNSRQCIHRAIDDGCLSCSVTAISPNGQFLAAGGGEGLVNLYNLNTLLQDNISVPVLIKVINNLRTPISALKFNPTSEILAIASDKKANAFKMLHLPSLTVFSNFPTFQTVLSLPSAIDFSPNSGYLGISNLFHKAYLFRLKHYGNY